MGMEVFLQKEERSQASIMLAQPFPAPELRAAKLTTLGFVWAVKTILHASNHTIETEIIT